MKRLLVILLFASAAHAQTLAPPTAEYNTKVGKVSHGSLQVQNDSLQPVAFVVESYSVTLDAQGPHWHALDPGATVDLSQSSGRLGPKQQIKIDYRASCSVLPCMLAINVGMVKGHTTDGFQVRTILVHFAYLAQSKKPRQEILIAAGLMQKK